eukprot:CAMPEP_0196812464 /NCGR_PEP_ID=MMETSP1362-20130617/26740_1 /TAXON_ID=163516 /ORGANISM="Leptocylindrus danicus, Strain CCMP1856" /LENGTH=42 /DNA_ID= /DNA_START= /DNA_END= /DNA_ORIENTATION=
MTYPVLDFTQVGSPAASLPQNQHRNKRQDAVDWNLMDESGDL